VPLEENFNDRFLQGDDAGDEGAIGLPTWTSVGEEGKGRGQNLRYMGGNYPGVEG